MCDAYENGAENTKSIIAEAGVGIIELVGIGGVNFLLDIQSGKLGTR